MCVTVCVCVDLWESENTHKLIKVRICTYNSSVLNVYRLRVWRMGECRSDLLSWFELKQTRTRQQSEKFSVDNCTLYYTYSYAYNLHLFQFTMKYTAYLQKFCGLEEGWVHFFILFLWPVHFFRLTQLHFNIIAVFIGNEIFFADKKNMRKLLYTYMLPLCLPLLHVWWPLFQVWLWG